MRLMTLMMSGILLMLMVSCSEGNSKPNFQFKKPTGNGIAVKMGDMVVSEEEVNKGLESELYEAEMKIFDIKMDKIRALLLEKIIAGDPDKKDMSNDEYLDKFIAKDVKVTAKEIENFIKERNIPKDQINDMIKKRIEDFLMVDKKREAVDRWFAEKTKNNAVEIFINKPQRPTFNVIAGNSPSTGNTNAKVTIVEFSDFQCPYCAKGVDIIHALEKKYGSKVNVVFKQFPLPFHTNAKKAAEAALCANEIGSKYFWKLHDWMFKNQNSLEVDLLIKGAKASGIDEAKIKSCLDSGRFAAQVEAEVSEGQALGIKSTPTFFVNGQLVSGAQPIEVFEEIIEEQLSL